MRWTIQFSFAVPACALALAGCGGIDMKPVASLSASNMMSPSGYSESKVSDTQYQVRATGTESTPKARIEKIARARAAQIGVEQKLKYYKVTNVRFAANCTKKHEFYKGGATTAGSRQTVMLDVVYAKEPPDPSYVSAAESYEALNGEDQLRGHRPRGQDHRRAGGAGRLWPRDLKLLRHAAAQIAAFYHRAGMRR